MDGSIQSYLTSLPTPSQPQPPDTQCNLTQSQSDSIIKHITNNDRRDMYMHLPQQDHPAVLDALHAKIDKVSSENDYLLTLLANSQKRIKALNLTSKRLISSNQQLTSSNERLTSSNERLTSSIEQLTYVLMNADIPL
tara:strand:+ start:99 stop:512 length:414 start_codon:yes stop_codon:yes gene_type:complete